MNKPVIPPGWRQLKDYEVVQGRDKFHDPPEDWLPCRSTIGSTPERHRDLCPFIRQEPEQKPEREWLNPWE